MNIPPVTISWLMEGDPSIRWQVQRDLLFLPETVWQSERCRVPIDGWGSQLLSLQDEKGTWAGGLYSPKWTSTTYTMLLLRRLGVPHDDHQAYLACRLLLDNGFYKDHGINFSKSMDHSETCVCGMVLSTLSYFRFNDPRLSLLAEHLLGQQMDDGGWNCLSYRGDRHSSFHTTINVLEGFYEASHFLPDLKQRFEEASAAAREFLLRHHLYRSERTGKVVDSKMTRFSFPPRWRYDVLRCLDYFQACNAPRDRRLDDAVNLLEKKRLPDSRWPLQNRHPGRAFFEMEDCGHPGRWNTLRALRVLQWWYA